MKRLAFGAAAAGGAAFALHTLAAKVRAMHAHCREMMSTQCSSPGTRSQPEETPGCA